MGKIRIQDLAKMMGVEQQDIIFKLKSIGLKVEGDDAVIDTNEIQAILEGTRLATPREVILRENPKSKEAPASLSRPGATNLRPTRRTMIQRVEQRIREIELKPKLYSLAEISQEFNIPLKSLRRYADLHKDDIPRKMHNEEIKYEEPAIEKFIEIDGEARLAAEQNHAGLIEYIERYVLPAEFASLRGILEELSQNFIKATEVVAHLENRIDTMPSKPGVGAHVSQLTPAPDHPSSRTGFEESIDHMKSVIEFLEKNAMDGIADLNRKVEKLNHKLEEKDATHDEVAGLERRIQCAQDDGMKLLQAPWISPLSAEELTKRLEELEFLIEKKTAEAILRNLENRRILVLQGVPGTGKSRLARLLPRILLDGDSQPFIQVTIGPEHTTYELIGGLRELNGRFAPHLGSLTESVIQCIESQGHRWLILDEINRGDISAILSPALSALDFHDPWLEHEFLFPSRTDPRGTIPIPGSFRIIGTMNTIDKDQLFRFSEALERRIGFAHLAPPEKQRERDLAERRVTAVITARSDSEEDINALKEKYGLDEVIDDILDVAHEIRQVAKREPARTYRRCELGSAIVIEIVERICTEIVREAISDSNTVLTLMDAAMSTVLFGNSQNWTYESLEALKDDVFSAEDRPPLPRCFAAIEKCLRETKIY